MLRNKREFERDASAFLSQVFADSKIEITSVKEVKCYVVAHGDVGLEDDEDNGVYVLDYLLSFDIIAASKNASLRELLSQVMTKQKEISDSIRRGATTLSIKLAGYVLRLPGFRPSAKQYLMNGTRTQPPGRNSPCICGSDTKYKKCCLELERLDDDVI